jgi:hypothetical protein
LATLINIDSSETVEYLLQRFGRQRQLKIVDNCVSILNNRSDPDKERCLYLFLDEVFQKNKDLSKDFHPLQVGLYIKYNKSKLFQFLQHTDAYQTEQAAELCRQEGLHKEHAYLLIRLGNKETAIKLLIEKCENVSDVIDLAVLFNINDDLLWDEILLKSLGKTERINQLLDYVDQYNKPVSIFLKLKFISKILL